MKKFSDFKRDEKGAMIIETAFVLPVLILLGLGGFEISQMVARNTEVQTAMAEATAVTLAVTPDTQGDIDTIEDIIENSTGLSDQDVTFTKKFRCGSADVMVTDETNCTTDTVVSEFLEIGVTRTYSPIWTEIGLGHDVQMNKTQLVQIGQFVAP